MSRCFQVDARDNGATLLEEAQGFVEVLGPRPQRIDLRRRIANSHKVAVIDIPNGAPIIKSGWDYKRRLKNAARSYV